MNFVNSIGNVIGNFHTLHVSGTIKSCQKYLAKYHRRSFEKLCKDFSGLSEEKKKMVEDSIKCEIGEEGDNDEEIENDMLVD